MTAASLVPGPVTARVPAKVNLELLVGPRRADGYHDLSTVFHAVSLYDDVTVAVADEWGVSVSGPLAEGVPQDGDNLAMRAARLVEGRFDVDPVHISIRKGIPVSGGMAGGSADAAATLVALDHLFELDLDREEIEELAAELGSDVPFLVSGGTAMGSGRGELLAPVLARGTYHWVFALAEGGLSTPAVYAECDRLRGTDDVPEPVANPALMSALRSGDPRELAPQLTNDLQEAALVLRPDLGEVLAAGMEYGALGGIVSGSGPTTAVPRRRQRGRHRPGRGPHRQRGGARRAPGQRPRPRRPRHPPPDRLVANLVSVERASLALGTAQVLDAVSLGVGGGDRIGVVGRNGGGKTTLLRVLEGSREVDTGRVARVGGLTIGVLTQDDGMDPAATVHETVIGDLPEHVWAADPRIRDVLTGLLGGTGAPAVGGMSAAVGPLSGGERRRVALAALLVASPDLLLLDEPTNHLDVEGVAWLADHLVTRHARPDNAVVAITHDRWFLDAIATQTWEVDSGSVHSYEGGYAAFVLAKAERERMAGVTAERRDNLLRKELAWLRRGPPARTSKPKFRIDAANALIADEPPARDDVELVRFATTRLGKDVVDLVDARIALGDRVLLDHLTWRLAPGERTGIVGVNGAGKSTLLRAIAGDLPLTAGKRKVGVTVRLAVLSQEVRELEAWSDRRVIEAVEAVRSVVRLGAKELTASQLAQRLGFTGPRQQTRVGDLSGGERRRLQLTRLLMDEPNVLLLDEPTNDLDIETLTSLEDLLDGWAGTLLVVSHDRYLLERVCDRQVALLGDGRLRDLPGGVDQYLRLRHEAAERAAVSVADAGRAASAVSSPPASGRPSAATSSVSPAEAREARKTMARVEKQLARLAQREERLHDAMLASATDHEKVLGLNRELREVVDERESLELEWLEAAEVIG